MVHTPDPETRWPRQLAVGLGALVVVSLVIGGVVSALALGAAKVSGIDDRGRPAVTQSPSLYMPSGEPTTRVDGFPDPQDGPDSATATASPSAGSTAGPTRKPPAITLRASPKQVAPGERINLTGTYRKGEGAELQVQRFQGSWVDFPVTVRVAGGRFATYITTSRTGPNRIRVLDPDGNRASAAARVTVG